jgi:hypothetical protein
MERRETNFDVVGAYSQFIDEKLEQGFDLYVTTMHYRHLPGRWDAQIKRMHAGAHKVYASLVTRVVRHPLRADPTTMPIMIAVPDFPVPKHNRQTLRRVAKNDGLHLHALVAIPPFSRLRQRWDILVKRSHANGFRPNGDLASLHVAYVDRTSRKVVDYVFKSLSRGRCTVDDILILPEGRAERTSTKLVLQDIRLEEQE